MSATDQEMTTDRGDEAAVEDATDKAVRVVVAGRVQGVWFRGWTVDQAQAMGLDGWVRNRADGTVEAVFRGSPELVDRAAAGCWRGPPSAAVTSITISPATDLPACDIPESGAGFAQRPTV